MKILPNIFKLMGLLKKSKIKDARPMATEACSKQVVGRQREEDAEFRLFQQPLMKRNNNEKF